MPHRTKSVCKRPGCGKACRGAYCDSCTAAGIPGQADRERLSKRNETCQRLYNSRAWRDRTAPRILRRDPLCKIAELCEGNAPSTHADHVIPAVLYVEQHGGDWLLFYDETNLQGACRACHTHKTRGEATGG